MANEKMMILKMLEEGKITAAEASRLLDSDGKKPSSANSGTQYTTHTANPGEDYYTTRPDSSRSSYNQNRPDTGSRSGSVSGGSFDEFTADLGKKFETFARDMEPKLQKFTEVFAEKTVNLADKISKTLASDTPSPAGSSTPPSPGSGTMVNFEMAVTPGYNELSIMGINGETRLKGYNGDKITAKVIYKTRRYGAAIELMKLGSKYYLSYDEDEFEKVSIDMYVPENMFNVVNITNMNGLLDIDTVNADSFSAHNTNGSSKISGISAETIKIDCSNGRLDLNSIKGRSAEIINFNAIVEAGALDIANMKLENGNGAVNINAAYLNSYAAYLWAIETSNAKLTLNLPTLPDLGYHIKAHTTLGNIKLGLTGMNYIYNDSSTTEAKSIHYDSASKKMKLSLETSNGTIHVN